ncbi:MAG: zinc ribbon domain-containing protein [Candidatus Thorarchaeota archaeon]
MQRVTYCLECGMPLVKQEDYGGEDTENRYCCHCTDEEGNLVRRSRVQDGIKHFWNQREKQDRRTEIWSDSRFVSRMANWRR